MGRFRGSTHQRGGRSSRRRTSWDEGPFSTEIALSAAGATLWTTGQTPILDGLTIVRTRGMWSFRLNSLDAAESGFEIIGVGIGVVTAPAFAAGVASVPSPLTEIDWDGWLFHEMVTDFHGNSATETWGNAGSTFYRGVIDSKAMRKIGLQDVVFGAVELGTESGTAVGEFTAHTRQLLKLP